MNIREKLSRPGAGFLGAGAVVVILMILGAMTPDEEETPTKPTTPASFVQGEDTIALYCATELETSEYILFQCKADK